VTRSQFVCVEHYQQNTVAICWAADPRQWRNASIRIGSTEILSTNYIKELVPKWLNNMIHHCEGRLIRLMKDSEWRHCEGGRVRLLWVVSSDENRYVWSRP